jgi:GNAT superfamily N-acetyltransferase
VPVTVRPLTSSRDLADWVQFPRRRVYPPASPWVPPLDRDLMRLLDRRKNPFFQQGEAVALLATDAAGQPVGRVLAQIYRPHNERHGERTAFFGFFECRDDQETATALIQAAARVGAAWGCDTLRGPFNLTAMQEMGILVDGFEYSPAVDQTYTPSYYPLLLEQGGLRRTFPHTTYRVDDVRAVALDSLLAERHRVLSVERRLVVRSARMAHFEQELEILRRLLNESFAELANFVPLTADELLFQVGAYRSYVDPNLFLVAEMDGVPRGFVLAVPDFNPLLKRLDGSANVPHIVGALPSVGRWLWQRDAVLVIQGVERRLQGQGIMRVLHHQLLHNLKSRRYRALSITWIADENAASSGSVRALGARPRHRLTLYECSIAALIGAGSSNS